MSEFRAKSLVYDKNSKLNSFLYNISFITSYTNKELANAYVDAFGVKYSVDKRCSLSNYEIQHGTEVICDGAFFNLHQPSNPSTINHQM